MNKRIKELAEQAGWMMSDELDGFNNRLERFAELIVEECCNWIDGSPSTDAGQSILTKSFIISGLKGYFRGE